MKFGLIFLENHLVICIKTYNIEYILSVYDIQVSLSKILFYLEEIVIRILNLTMFHGESKRLSKTLGIYKMEDDYEPLELKWKMGEK